jgi:hypothetical protein
MCWEKAEGGFTAWMDRLKEERPEDVELREVTSEPEEEVEERPEREKVLEHV